MTHPDLRQFAELLLSVPHAGPLPQVIAIIGGAGYNFTTRIWPLFQSFNGRFRLDLYDVAEPLRPLATERFVAVRNDLELRHRLIEAGPRVVIIETPGAMHPRHIQAALESGAELVLCEKPIAITAAEACDVWRTIPPGPRQDLRILDHYALLELVLALRASRHKLGRLRRLEFRLFEKQGIPRSQERSHFDGMSNVMHHFLALVAVLLGLDDLVPVQAAWARHPSECVPDTYRSAAYLSGGVEVIGAVGKRMPEAVKELRLIGEQGEATLDRITNQLRIRAGHWRETITCAEDTGYRSLVTALAAGERLPSTLLSPATAARIVELIDAAHAISQELPAYPASSSIVF
jgi:predicted dehydrogenase